jgi:hypothetical protein
MSGRASRKATWGLAAGLAALLAACGSNGNLTVGGTAPTPTPTATPETTATQPPTVTPTTVPTPTATAQPSASVAGLVVLRRDVASAAPDALGIPPDNWAAPADAATFDRAMASADWTVEGPASKRGVTGADGRFTIGALPPGRYTLQVSKTVNGNLVPVTIPFTVGDDGGAAIVAEVGMGLVRASVTYVQAGVHVREVRGPYGNVLVTRDGQISKLGDAGRTLVDANGDGTFEVGSCDATDPCVCVPSCPECTDCASRVCVPNCTPVDITSVTVTAPDQLVVGRQTQATASALLSDGSAIDVTHLASWQSFNEAVATIDSWGTISALTIGETTLTARVGAVESAPQPLSVVERPTLQRIVVQNQSCFCGPVPLAGPEGATALPSCIFSGAPVADILPVPSCGQVVLVGATLQFSAIGKFADGSYEDLTKDVQWQLTPAAVGSVATGLFTAGAAGTAQLTAALDGVASEATEIRVVDHATLDSLSIYPNVGYGVVAGGTISPGDASPCFDCGAAVTVLRGDQLRFQATAHYDTGEWRDVTDSVTWRSSDGATAGIDAAGVMTALQGGDTVIDATLAGVTSNPVNLRVVNAATLQSIAIYQEGTDRVVSKGDQRFFRATGYYDVGITRDVTAEAAWRSSDDSIGGFDSPGVFIGRAAGTVQVWAQLGGQSSPPLSLEVFELTELAYCDPNSINRTLWSDDFNRVTLESDCATYTEPGLVTLRYTVTETQPHGGVFDPCLDLYVYQGDELVRTIREQGCGAAFLAGNAPGSEDAALKYQLRAFWDLKDSNGAAVPSGSYTIYGRFYLYYDPVVKLPITVFSGSEPVPTRTPTPVPPTPVSDGKCVRSTTPESCDAVSVAGSQFQCCVLAQESLSPVPFWWCPAEQADPTAPQCQACSEPCAGVPVSVPSPTTPDVNTGMEGACYIGSSKCTGPYFPAAQAKCCELFRFSANPLASSWCPTAQLDASGQCAACPTTPCDGLASAS